MSGQLMIDRPCGLGTFVLSCNQSYDYTYNGIEMSQFNCDHPTVNKTFNIFKVNTTQILLWMNSRRSFETKSKYLQTNSVPIKVE